MYRKNKNKVYEMFDTIGGFRYSLGVLGLTPVDKGGTQCHRECCSNDGHERILVFY